MGVAHLKAIMPKFTIADIESGPRPEADLVIPEFEANKTYKDPAKIAVDLEAKKKAWLDDAALHADRGMVLAIGLFDHNRKTLILEGNEKAFAIVGEILRVDRADALDVGADAATVEQRLRQFRAKRPDRTLAIQQGGQFVALKTECAG